MMNGSPLRVIVLSTTSLVDGKPSPERRLPVWNGPEGGEALSLVALSSRLFLMGSEPEEELRHLAAENGRGARFAGVISVGEDEPAAWIMGLKLVMDEEGALPTESVMVGTRLSMEILPGNALGWVTVFLENGKVLQVPHHVGEQPRYTASSLAALPDILEDLDMEADRE